MGSGASTGNPTKPVGTGVGGKSAQYDRKTLEVFSRQARIEFPTPFLLRMANIKGGDAAINVGFITTRNDSQIVVYPKAPISGKNEAFDALRYRSLDEFVDGVTYDCNMNFKLFTILLTNRCGNDPMANIRVIFRWLCSLDLSNYDKNREVIPDSVDAFIRVMQLSPVAITDVFAYMWRTLGGVCMAVTGYTRQENRMPPEEPPETAGNKWLIIRIDGEWRFIDPYWCSCSSTVSQGEWRLIDNDGNVPNAQSSPEGPPKTTYECDETYFLTDPEQMIYTHFPIVACFQLLARPVTYQEFAEMACLEPGFFHFELELLDQRKHVLYASEGEIDIRIGTPENRHLGFKYKLWMSDEENTETVPFERYCIMQQKNRQLVCKIMFPLTGKFKLELLCANISRMIPIYSEVCSFIIHADKPADDIKALPKNTRNEWGPGYDLQEAGLHPVTHHDAIIEAEDGTVEIKLRYETPIKVHHKMYSNDKNFEALRRYVAHYLDTTNKHVVFNIKLPEAGDYALNLFAEDEEENISSICNYIVSTVHPSTDIEPFPEVTELGQSISATSPKLKLVSHPSPIITCPDLGEMIIEFVSSAACESSAELKLVTSKREEKKGEYTWVTHVVGNKVKVEINFPDAGTFILNMATKAVGDGDAIFEHVYTCIIQVVLPQKECFPFPEKNIHWKPEYQLIEPTTNEIKSNSDVRIAVMIPKAVGVRLMRDDNNVIDLNKGAKGLWSKDINTGDPGTLHLMAKTSKDIDYDNLLTYQVLDEKKYSERIECQEKKLKDAIIAEEKRIERMQEEEKRRKELFANTKKDLLAAIEMRDSQVLWKAVKAAQKYKYTSRLQEELATARQLIKSLKRIDTLNTAMLKMDQKTMLEIRGYANPPTQVHDVISATLLLLGTSEGGTKEWLECQKHLTTIGNEGMNKRIKTFDVRSLHPEIASRALQKIGHYRLDDVRVISAGAATFYDWTAGMIQEVHLRDPKAKQAPAANIRRQLQIFEGK